MKGDNKGLPVKNWSIDLSVLVGEKGTRSQRYQGQNVSTANYFNISSNAVEGHLYWCTNTNLIL